MSLNRSLPEVSPVLNNGKQIVDAARDEALRTVAAAREQAAAIIERAELEGFERGQARAAALISEASIIRERARDEARCELQDVLCAIASDVVGSTLSEMPELISCRVERALQEISAERAVRLFLNPAAIEHFDHAIVERHPSLVIQADSSLSSEEARLEADGITILSSPRQHLAALLESLDEHS